MAFEPLSSTIRVGFPKLPLAPMFTWLPVMRAPLAVPAVMLVRRETAPVARRVERLADHEALRVRVAHEDVMHFPRIRATPALVDRHRVRRDQRGRTVATRGRRYHEGFELARGTHRQRHTRGQQQGRRTLDEDAGARDLPRALGCFELPASLLQNDNTLLAVTEVGR